MQSFQSSRLRVDRRQHLDVSRPHRRFQSSSPIVNASSVESPSNQRGANEELLGAFFVGRATASLLNKRIGADIVEVANKGISVEWLQQRIATRDERIRIFREEALKQAADEMESQLGWVAKGLDEAASSPSPASLATKGTVDLQAEVDELRASIAQARQTVRAMLTDEPVKL